MKSVTSPAPEMNTASLKQRAITRPRHLPCGGRTIALVWHKSRWRCTDPDCGRRGRKDDGEWQVRRLLLRNTPLPGPWLRTGDLGFLLDGRLFIVGRTDDVIIVRGRNHYPDDIESDVRAATPCTAVAFSTIEDGQQRLVVLVEPLHPSAHATPEDRAAMVETVRKAVIHGHGIEPREVIPVRRGVIPRTTSGKIQRSRCRWIHENGEFG